MNDYINKLLVDQSVVEELKNKNKASYSNAFVTVINAINAEIVESLKNDSSTTSKREVKSMSRKQNAPRLSMKERQARAFRSVMLSEQKMMTAQI